VALSPIQQDLTALHSKGSPCWRNDGTTCIAAALPEEQNHQDSVLIFFQHPVYVLGEDASMEAVHTQGIWIAERLQQTTISHAQMWLTVTHIGDPKAAFLLLFPFTYFISKRTGIAVLWIASVSEWLNLVVKW